MLGLASTVSSSSTPESKYSLDFDGADDFLDTGATFNTTFAGDFSISMWVKPDDGQNSVQYFFGSANSSVNDSVRAFISSGKVGFILEAHDSTITRVDTNSTVFSAGAATSWTHLGFMANITGTGSTKTTLHVYVNGVQVAQSYTSQNVTGAEHSQWESNQNLAIGDYNNNGSTGSNPYNGKIDEVSIWNAALDEASVQAIYNKGGQYDLTSGLSIGTEPLVAYYRMGNGTFDDKANGVVHDQHASGFGSDVVTDGSFPSGTSAWTIRPSTTINGGSATITGLGSLTSTASNHSISQAVTGYTVGKSYKVTFTAKQLTGTGAMYGGIGYNNIFNQVVTSEYLTYTFYQTVSDDRGGVWENIVFGGVLATGGDTANTFEIKGISVKQLNGLPGFTSGGPTFSSDIP